MTIPQSIVLGAIQGVAEFLPISSSGHLAIAAEFMDLAEVPLLFDVSLHVATLLAVCVVFRARIASLFAVLGRLVVGKGRDDDAEGRRMILALVIATAVTGAIGLAVKDVAEAMSPFAISLCFIVTGAALFLSGRLVSASPVATPGIRQALVVGLAQGIGVFPGISRSGSTIAASLLSGLDRRAAGEFSFLLSIPAILAAFILELKDADTLIGSVSALPLVAGLVTAFATGLLSLKFLLGLINRGRLGWFAFYLVPLGIALACYFGVAR